MNKNWSQTPKSGPLNSKGSLTYNKFASNRNLSRLDAPYSDDEDTSMSKIEQMLSKRKIELLEDKQDIHLNKIASDISLLRSSIKRIDTAQHYNSSIFNIEEEHENLTVINAELKSENQILKKRLDELKAEGITNRRLFHNKVCELESSFYASLTKNNNIDVQNTRPSFENDELAQSEDFIVRQSENNMNRVIYLNDQIANLTKEIEELKKENKELKQKLLNLEQLRSNEDNENIIEHAPAPDVDQLQIYEKKIEMLESILLDKNFTNHKDFNSFRINAELEDDDEYIMRHMEHNQTQTNECVSKNADFDHLLLSSRQLEDFQIVNVEAFDDNQHEPIDNNDNMLDQKSDTTYAEFKEGIDNFMKLFDRLKATNVFNELYPEDQKRPAESYSFNEIVDKFEFITAFLGEQMQSYKENVKTHFEIVAKLNNSLANMSSEQFNLDELEQLLSFLKELGVDGDKIISLTAKSINHEDGVENNKGYDHLKNKYDNLKDQLKKIKNGNLILEENKNLKSTIHQMESLKTQNDYLENRSMILKSKLDINSVELQHIKKLNNSITEKNNIQTQDIDNLKLAVEERNDIIEDLKRRLQAYENKLETANKMTEDKTHELEKQISAVKHKKKEIKKIKCQIKKSSRSDALNISVSHVDSDLLSPQNIDNSPSFNETSTNDFLSPNLLKKNKKRLSLRNIFGSLPLSRFVMGKVEDDAPESNDNDQQNKHEVYEEYYED